MHQNATIRHRKPEHDEHSTNRHDRRGRPDHHGGKHRDDDGFTVEIEDPHAVVDGKTIAQWTQHWLKWALNSEGHQPGLDTTGGAANFNNDGKIYFIAGWSGVPGADIHRSFDVPAGTPILFPMISAWDTEGPGIATLQNFPGTPAEQAKEVTRLIKDSIYDAHATLSKAGGGEPLIDVQWPESRHFAETTGIFKLGTPQPGGEIASRLGGIILDLTIADLPFTRQTGYWLMIEGLKPGDYTLDFGGRGNAVVDNTGAVPVVLPDFQQDWGTTVHDTLHVMNFPP